MAASPSSVGSSDGDGGTLPFRILPQLHHTATTGGGPLGAKADLLVHAQLEEEQKIQNVLSDLHGVLEANGVANGVRDAADTASTTVLVGQKAVELLKT